MGLLATFRLAGVLYEPATASVLESIVLDTVEWELERPGGAIGVGDDVESRYNDDNALIIQDIHVGNYHPDYFSIGYGRSPLVDLSANVTASVRVGFVKEVSLVFRESNESSRLNFYEEHQLMKFKNLSRTDLKDWATEAYVNMSGINSPSNVGFQAPIDWVLYSPYDQTHQLEITSRITYYNGTIYKRIVQPFRFKLFGDNNNSFDTAQEVHEGVYERLFIGPPVVADERD